MAEQGEGNLIFIKVGPLGQFGNNAYVVGDAATKEVVIIDAPQESEKTLAAAAGLHVSGILVTHGHGDHWAEIDLLRERTNAPVRCHEADRDAYASKVSGVLRDGDVVPVGGAALRVIHTPGHTPGSVCLLVRGHLISGDTLFPGGPGRSGSPAELKREIESITSRLLTLPDTTAVHPGHGDDTTIAAAKAEYAAFAARPHPADLAGDVTWAG